MVSNELVKTGQAKTIRDLFNSPAVRSEIAKALPKHLTTDRLLRVAMTSIQRTPKLLECNQKSLLACIMTCASLGLEPDQFLGQAYLVPFWNNKANQMEAQLIPGYRGYIALARRSGEVQSVSAQVVYANDFFDLQFGLTEKLDHRPAEGERGEVRGAYVVFKYKDGSHSFDYMPKSEIDKIRERSKSSGSGPWVTDYAEMAKKTVIKRHAKLAPLSVEFQTAVALEDRSNIGESQADLLNVNEPIDAEFTNTAIDPPGTEKKPVTFQDDPAGDKKERKPRSDKGTKRTADTPQEAAGEAQGEEIRNTMHPDSDEPPMANELERLRAEIKLHSSAHKDVVQAALADTGIAHPTTIDGCRVVLEAIEARIAGR